MNNLKFLGDLGSIFIIISVILFFISIWSSGFLILRFVITSFALFIIGYFLAKYEIDELKKK